MAELVGGVTITVAGKGGGVAERTGRVPDTGGEGV